MPHHRIIAMFTLRSVGVTARTKAPIWTIESAARMLGTDKSRGYSLEMICADFLAGAHLDNGDPEVLLHSISPTTSSCPANNSRLSSKTCVRRRPENDPPQSRLPATGPLMLSTQYSVKIVIICPRGTPQARQHEAELVSVLTGSPSKPLLKTWHLVALFGRNDILPPFGYPDQTNPGPGPVKRSFPECKWSISGRDFAAIRFCLAGLFVGLFAWLWPTHPLMDTGNANLSSNEPEIVTSVQRIVNGPIKECHAAVSQRGAPSFPPRS